MSSENFLTTPEMAKKSKHEHDKSSENLREGLTLIFSKCHSKELSVCPHHAIFQPQKAIKQILKYFKGQIEQMENPHSPRKFISVEGANPDDHYYAGCYDGYKKAIKDFLVKLQSS